jgi:hypothetical protein
MGDEDMGIFYGGLRKGAKLTTEGKEEPQRERRPRKRGVHHRGHGEHRGKKRKVMERSLHCAARRTTKRRERKVRPLRSG